MMMLDVVRTEYSFGTCYGQLDKVIAACTGTHVLIADNNTWGHIPFWTACTKAGKVPVLGVTIGVCEDVFQNKNRQPDMWVIFAARNNLGLQELYGLVKTSHGYFHYQPRLGIDDLLGISSNINVILGNSKVLSMCRPLKQAWLGVSPANYRYGLNGVVLPRLAHSDVFYPRPEHREAYEILCRAPENKTTAQYILTAAEMRAEMRGVPEEVFEPAWAAFCKEVEIDLPKADNIHIDSKKTLKQMCVEGAKRKHIDLKDKVYAARLRRELDLISAKKFEDYFYLVNDLCVEAKKVMLVGPGRGSSAGSLVCYLLDITEVDPIPHNLLFERFIDVSRPDLPDVDLDFPEQAWVFKYLQNKYGEDKVAHLGNVLRYQAKSAITNVSKALRIPEWEVKAVKDAVIERSGGDARAAFCLKDTFESLDVGKALLEKYPALGIAAELEEHCFTTGVHAAGIVVCNEPVWHYGGVNNEHVLHMDKRDAEKINLLKIDALGLRTMIILQDVLEQIGEGNEYLYTLPLDDEKAFALLTAGRYAGIFQFEGYALKSLTAQMGVKNFSDIVAITSLARPGPLHNGAATEYIQRRIGAESVSYAHPCLEQYTKDTLGVIIFQEQVMQIVNGIGKFSWEDTAVIRKAMSKSFGEEYFGKFKDKFVIGAAKDGIKKADAEDIFKSIMTFGSWAFNASHGVSYAYISYWCAHCKAHYPLEFAAATLRNLKDDDQAVKVLRELVKEGYGYVPFDPQLSDLNWSVQNGQLVGGWLGVRGVGMAKAVAITNKIKNGIPLSAAEQRLAYDPIVAWADLFPAERLYGHLYKDYEGNGLSMPVSVIDAVQSVDGEYLVIGRVLEKNQRDANEYGNLVKRGGRVIKHNSLWLNLLLEDDSGNIIATIPRDTYEELGKPIIEGWPIGTWGLFRGYIKNGWRKLTITKVRRL
jgi:DNA polymerase III alpha subunit